LLLHSLAAAVTAALPGARASHTPCVCLHCRGQVNPVNRVIR
jgi:hypothetical protein